MGVFDVLSGLSTAAGKGFEGYGVDRQIDVKNLLAAKKAADDEQRNRVLNIIGMAGIDPTVQGKIAGARAGATAPVEVKKAIDIASGTAPIDTKKAIDIHAGEAPIDVKKAVDIETGTAPTKVAVANREHQFATEHPAQSFSPVVTTAPGGEQHVSTLNTKTGEIKDTGVGAKAGATPGGPNAPQTAAAKANLESARKTMDDYEEKLRRGEASYGPFDATKGALGSAEQAQTGKGIFAPAESFVANVSGASLRGDNPDLANYLKAKKFVAEAILNTHKRPNQTQYEIEQELSGIGPRFGGWESDDAKKQIAQSKERRDRMFNEVFGGDASGGGGRKVVVNGKTFIIP